KNFDVLVEHGFWLVIPEAAVDDDCEGLVSGAPKCEQRRSKNELQCREALLAVDDVILLNPDQPLPLLRVEHYCTQEVWRELAFRQAGVGLCLDVAPQLLPLVLQSPLVGALVERDAVLSAVLEQLFDRNRLGLHGT